MPLLSSTRWPCYFSLYKRRDLMEKGDELGRFYISRRPVLGSDGSRGSDLQYCFSRSAHQP
ncbi:hypothetical protein RRG08_022291 [Elysia crispata]|uniref:Uncharacterized protein n=1 Tax=Elysia crispata TaxID=231223 RepID=A0AAE1DKA2_9GAST|nr:hypothetical protein RRG08_022291 [Elysia crispata]